MAALSNIKVGCHALYVASTEVKWSNGKAEISYRVEAVLMGVETVMVCCSCSCICL